MADSIKGWVMVKTGDSENGIKQIEKVIESWQASKATLGLGMFYTLLADAYHHAGYWKEGIEVMEKADATLSKMEERVFFPALYMLRGRCFLSLGQPDEALRWLTKAYELAQAHDNYLVGMQAAVPLAELWLDTGEKNNASILFNKLYDPNRKAVNISEMNELQKRLLS
jgi:tetratricopeptide (TPR) repeat protein